MDGYEDDLDLESPPVDSLPALLPSPQAMAPVELNNAIRAPYRPPRVAAPQPQPSRMRMPPMPGALMHPLPPQQNHVEAVGTAPEMPTGHMLGLSVILPAAGTVTGLKYAGGLYGGMGGALAAGSLINGYRALKHVTKGTPEDDKEALISGTYCLLGLGGAIYLILKGLEKKSPKMNRKGKGKPVEDDDDEDDEDDDNDDNDYRLNGVK